MKRMRAWYRAGRARRWLRRLAGWRCDREALAQGFREAPGSKLWPAVLAELDRFTVEVGDRAIYEERERAVTKALGGQEVLLELRERLDAWEAWAQKVEDEKGPPL